jgi:hypothetical protein
MGVTLDNFIPTAYNLLPYSFVIDYFSNLGQIVNALSFCNGRVNWVNRTQRTVGKCTAQSGQVRSPGSVETDQFVYTYIEEQNSPATTKVTKTAFTRTSVSNVPIPTLELKFPTSGTVWTNLGALLLSRSRAASKLIGAILE